MCGIIGIFGENESKVRAYQSLQMVVHRGGNTFEVAGFGNAAIGANRLPIVDREHAKQPLKNEDSTVFAVQNGEIYNHKKLQKELESKGHVFETNSDTEVLVHLFEEYGAEMVNKIDSEMFAFVIFDHKNNSIFVARDPFGVKPLYWATDKSGQIYFASELKQLSIFDDIENIKEFPVGHYYFNGKMKQYHIIKASNVLKNENKIVALLEEKIVNAVAKRVDTDLPIGVLLSGGVDSSLVMEIAARHHKDVTAIILGHKGSSDYEFALKLCKERKYRYHIVKPSENFGKDVDDVIFHTETFEPNVIRHSFAVAMCAKAASELGLRIVLVGEGSDEIFCGYNEFSNVCGALINKASKLLVENLHSSQLQRVDRMTMKHTIEARVPLLDKEVVELALKIDGSLKIKKRNEQLITKYIFRKVAEKYLPDYIAWRYKMPFSNGAGMNVGNDFKLQDGDVAKAVLKKKIVAIDDAMIKKYQINTDEEKYYLGKFFEYGFSKLQKSERAFVKERIVELNVILE
jgi:asparagine synthase (glutamine-hydrolysing)